MTNNKMEIREINEKLAKHFEQNRVKHLNTDIAEQFAEDIQKAASEPPNARSTCLPRDTKLDEEIENRFYDFTKEVVARFLKIQ